MLVKRIAELQVQALLLAEKGELVKADEALRKLHELMAALLRGEGLALAERRSAGQKL